MRRMHRFVALLVAALPVTALSLGSIARDRPPDELLASNMAECAYTARVYVEHVDVAQTSPSDDGRTGYVTLKLDVTVLESFGEDPPFTIVLYETVEAPAHPPQAKERLLVSFRKDSDGHFVIPDNGYVFPDDPDVLQRARKLRHSRIYIRSS